MLAKSEPVHLSRGKEAEDRACDWLMARGKTIVARNVRYKLGEIDIIAKDGDVLCFVEVRSRGSVLFGTPQATVGSVKQGKLIKAAMLYLKQNYQRQPFCRFDVIAVTGYGLNAEVEYFPNAFQVPHEPRRTRGSPWQAY
jgi:putative endonuclease